VSARVVVGALVVFGALAVVSVVTFFSNRELYFGVDELATQSAALCADRSGAELLALGGPSAAPGARRLQVRGRLDESSVRRDADGLLLRFDLFGDRDTLAVIYGGLVPDTFEEAQQVTVGGWLGADGVFAADQVLVQCPSKYEPAEPTSPSEAVPTARAP
jgi:cytochrome c-type biogenesis protein CcmE